MQALHYHNGLRMQHNIAGCNTMLLGGTFSLLTHGCHRGIPQGIQGMSVRLLKLADKHSLTRSTRSVLSGCPVDSYHEPAQQFYPSREGAFSLRSPLAPLFVTHPVGIRAQQQYRLYSGTSQRLVRCAARRRNYPFFL